MSMILNDSDKIETINITISEEKMPIAYNNKIKELMSLGDYKTVEEAKADNPYFNLDMEIYYEINNGFFMVEAEAVDSYAEIYSPYNGEECLYPENIDKEKELNKNGN